MSALIDARKRVGGLSKPSKMPGMAYSLPAKECKVGGNLAKLPGTVCTDCYALKGRYMFGNVQTALYRRLGTIGHPGWADDMATAINGQEYFRWHDSGDIQSLEHLEKIARVCELTPKTKHWLPTREKKIVRQFMRRQAIPDNLVIRVSGTFIDGQPPAGFDNTSTVHTESAKHGGRCPAPDQDNKCGDCRACWDKSAANISYGKH